MKILRRACARSPSPPILRVLCNTRRSRVRAFANHRGEYAYRFFTSSYAWLNFYFTLFFRLILIVPPRLKVRSRYWWYSLKSSRSVVRIISLCFHLDSPSFLYRPHTPHPLRRCFSSLFVSDFSLLRAFNRVRWFLYRFFSRFVLLHCVNSSTALTSRRSSMMSVTHSAYRLFFRATFH